MDIYLISKMGVGAATAEAAMMDIANQRNVRKPVP